MIRLLAGALTALVLLVAAPTASAAITLTYTGTTIGIQGSGENATFVAFDMNATPQDPNDDTVTVRNSTGVDNQSGGMCIAIDTPPLGTYFHCPASATALSATYGAGNDRLTFENVCIQTITAALGDGPGEFQRPNGCPTDQTAVVTGGSAADLLLGGDGPDDFTGGGGDDQIRSGAGNDVLRGGQGNDDLQGQDGNDQLLGEDGNDKLRGGAGDDMQNGGEGDDVLGEGDADSGADDLRGGPGTDQLDLITHAPGVTVTIDDVANDGVPGEGDNVHTDVERLYGTPGPDTITGSPNADFIDGHFGPDTVRGGDGNDSIDGNSDSDQLFGDAGTDTVYGGGGDDRVEGGAGVDSLFGDYASCSAFGCSGGNDQLFARDGENDALNCGAGADTAQVDAGDTIGQDGFQQCETVDRSAPAPGPGAGPTPGTATGTSGALAAGAKVTPGVKRFTVAFTLRRAATVTLTVTRKGAKKALGKVTIKAKAGKTTRTIRKVGKRTLRKGTYKVVLRVGSTTRTFTVKVR